GIFTWLKRKGYPMPNRWDGRTAPPSELDYVAATPTGSEPDGHVVNLRRARTYPPDWQYAGFPLPACFTTAGTSVAAQFEGATGKKRLKEFTNTNQLGCCLSAYHM